MKKVLVSIVTVVTLLTSIVFAQASTSKDNFTVRLRENTLVVASAQMEEARLYSINGKLLEKKQGTFAEFELERGTYRLFAKVNGETVARRIELR